MARAVWHRLSDALSISQAPASPFVRPTPCRIRWRGFGRHSTLSTETVRRVVRMAKGESITASLQDIPDARLVVQALAGSQPAFREIVRRYERPVFNLISRIVRNPSVAEDVTQDAFLKVFRHLAAFDTGRKFSSWIFRIAHNSALDALRRTRDDAVLDGPHEHPVVVPTPDPVEAADLAQALEAALDGLRPELRAALVLRYQEECSYEEIADVMGIPEGTAKTFVHRARKQMADLLTAAGWRP